MDSLNELKIYIETQINSIAENGKIIEQSQSLVNKLENLYVLLTNNNYVGIDLNNFKDCLNFIFEGEDVNLIIEKVNQAITIVNDDIYTNEPQRPVAEEYLNKINVLILKNIEKLKENIMKIKAEVDDKVFDYKEYSDLIKDGQIVRHLSDKDLKKFFFRSKISIRFDYFIL